MDNGITGDFHVVITGLANTYCDYVTTPEEYSVQRYEGASTIYGPYTLPGFIQEFNKLAVAMAKVKSTYIMKFDYIHVTSLHVLLLGQIC